MGGFIVVRMLDGIVKLLLVSMILFWVLVVLPPGNPAFRFAGKTPTEASVKAVEERSASTRATSRRTAASSR